jgi:hypothetical protein
MPFQRVDYLLQNYQSQDFNTSCTFNRWGEKTTVKINIQVNYMYHLKAHNVIYITTKVKTVILHAYSTQRATKESMHKDKIDKSPHIYMDKTAPKNNLAGQ